MGLHVGLSFYVLTKLGVGRGVGFLRRSGGSENVGASPSAYSTNLKIMYFIYFIYLFIYLFIFIPLMIFALLFSLPPSRNSDPGSHSRLFFLLPTTVRTLNFYRENASALLDIEHHDCVVESA